MITGVSIRVVFTLSANRFTDNRDHPIPCRAMTEKSRPKFSPTSVAWDREHNM